jgi:5-methylcytosine-specific restriction protein A
MTHTEGESRWAHLYERRSWRRRSRLQLAAHPLCEECLKRGIVEPAVASHHITPHNGDMRLFYGPLESVCAACHNRKRPLEKGRKPRPVIGVDGWPEGE